MVTDMFSLRFSRSSIETSLKNLANGKAVGDDGIPNEFLKNGGEAMLNSLVDLFTISQIFQRSFDRCPRKSQREHIS
jgi:hypothetical protein